jgi:hypothetical protein
MSDLINIQAGSLPWEPAADADVVEVFDRYDMPTVGVIHQGGHHFVFECLFGHGETMHAWLYTGIEEHELEALRETANFDAELESILEHRPYTAALATDADGVIVDFHVSEPSDYESPIEAVLDKLTHVVEELSGAVRHAHRFSHGAHAQGRGDKPLASPA